MLAMLLSRTSFSYFMMLIINPIIILCFQNCSVVKMSDIKMEAPKPSIAAPIKQIAL